MSLTIQDMYILSHPLFNSHLGDQVKAGRDFIEDLLTANGIDVKSFFRTVIHILATDPDQLSNNLKRRTYVFCFAHVSLYD